MQIPVFETNPGLACIMAGGALPFPKIRVGIGVDMGRLLRVETHISFKDSKLPSHRGFPHLFHGSALAAWIHQNLFQKRHIKQNLLHGTPNNDGLLSHIFYLFPVFNITFPCRAGIFKVLTQSSSTNKLTQNHAQLLHLIFFLTSFPPLVVPHFLVAHIAVLTCHWSISAWGSTARWRGSPKNLFEGQAETDYPGYSWRRTCKRRHEKRHVFLGKKGRIWSNYYE